MFKRFQDIQDVYILEPGIIAAIVAKKDAVEGSPGTVILKFFNDKDMVPTDVPMMNVALSGSVDGGLAPGLTVLAGPSKHFKTSFALIMASAYLKKYDDAVILFYDSEFGSPQSYFTQFDIDADRVLHTPIANVEQLKFDLVGQLEELDRGDKVVVVIDSICLLYTSPSPRDS